MKYAAVAVLASLAATAVAMPPAHALIFSYSPGAAAACVPVTGQPSLNQGFVRFRGSATGTIVLNCPIDARLIEQQQNAPSNLAVGLGYRDPNGTATSASVKAALVEESIFSGGSTIVTPLFNSNTLSSTGKVYPMGTTVVPPVFSFSAAYYLRVELKRSLASQKVEFYSYWFRTTP